MMTSLHRLQPIALVMALTVLGLIGFSDFQNRATARALASTTDDLTQMTLDFSKNLAERDDPAELLTIGYRLLKNSEPQFAVAAFDRARAVAPGNRDAHLYLGWALLAVIDTRSTTLSNVEAQDTLVRAKTSVAEAKRLDPLATEANELLVEIERLEMLLTENAQ